MVSSQKERHNLHEGLLIASNGFLPVFKAVMNHIRKTPLLLFCAFSCFFYFFMKKVEKAQKSQVLHLPECFLRQSKKYIAFKSILGQKSTAKKLQVVIKWK